MPFMALAAADFVLKVAVPTIVIDLPLGLLPITAHLWVVALCAT
jgi:hypothetical protein